MTRRCSLLLRRAKDDARGATLVEFGFVAPIFCLLLVGVMDVGHTLYMRAVLQGVVQKAARDSGLENGSESTRQAEIDARIHDSVVKLHNGANVDITRRYYRTFEKASAATAESFTDTNANGTCDNGEPYQDDNNNNVWDSDGGDAGQGAAKDVVVYTADVSYPRIIPLQNFIPSYPDIVHVKAVTVMANQPFGEQSQYAAPTVRNCPV
tara:strand:- start:25904 stop:26530 length:627 start_codon:yes stop_codon:yes gene_type:complete